MTTANASDGDHSDPAVVEDQAGALRHQIDASAHELTGRGPAQLLESIAALGLAWRDIAALVGVSVPKVRRLRAGGTATDQDCLRIAHLLALLEWLGTDQRITDVASWLEAPLRAGVPVSRLTLLLHDHEDLVIASLAGPEFSPLQLLESFAPDWRDRYDSAFEVFAASDGQQSIRPRAE